MYAPRLDPELSNSSVFSIKSISAIRFLKFVYQVILHILLRKETVVDLK
jgi:hypothetical protein